MVATRMIALAALGAGALGLAAGIALPALPGPAPGTAAPPLPAGHSDTGNLVVADLGQVIVPVWQDGRVEGFVAAGVTVRLRPGASPHALAPLLRHTVLAGLYGAGRAGRLDPAGADVPALERDLLAAIHAITPDATGLSLDKLVRQENRQRAP